MTDHTLTAPEFADAAAIILTDAVASVDESGSDGALQEVLSSMIERHADYAEFVHLAHALAAVATMAVAAELRASIDDDTAAGPAVDMLVRLRDNLGWAA